MTKLVHCRRCDARYDSSIDWVHGYRRAGSTSDEMIVVRSGRKGDCPICEKPPGAGPKVEPRPL